MTQEGQGCPAGGCHIQGRRHEYVACAVTQYGRSMLDLMLCSSGLEPGN